MSRSTRTSPTNTVTSGTKLALSFERELVKDLLLYTYLSSGREDNQLQLFHNCKDNWLVSTLEAWACFFCIWRSLRLTIREDSWSTSDASSLIPLIPTLKGLGSKAPKARSWIFFLTSGSVLSISNWSQNSRYASASGRISTVDVDVFYAYGTVSVLHFKFLNSTCEWQSIL